MYTQKRGGGTSEGKGVVGWDMSCFVSMQRGSGARAVNGRKSSPGKTTVSMIRLGDQPFRGSAIVRQAILTGVPNGDSLTIRVKV